MKLPSGYCRILFSSQDVGNIRKELQNKPTISFQEEKDGHNADIQAYVHKALADVQENYKLHKHLVNDIKNQVITKAGSKCQRIYSNSLVNLLYIGMFL